MRNTRRTRSVRVVPPKDEGSRRLHAVAFCLTCRAPVPRGALVCYACGARAAVHPWLACGQVRMD